MSVTHLCRLPFVCNAFLSYFYNAFFFKSIHKKVNTTLKGNKLQIKKIIGRKTFNKLRRTRRSIETWMTMTTTTTTAKGGKGKSGYDATRDGENTRLQQDAARGKGAWDCEKYEEIRPEDEAKVFEEIATANEGDFLFEGERCCS